MKRIGRIFSTALTVLMLMSLLSVPAAATEPLAVMSETTILFTHDMHSHFLPVENADGSESGGYARLKTAIDRERAATVMAAG